MSDYDFNNMEYSNRNGGEQNFTRVNGNYNDDFGTGGPQKPKKKKGLAGVIAAVATVGVLAGGLVTGFVIVPALNQAPAAQVEVLDEAAEAQTMEETPQYGGDSFQIQNVANPVPEIAENLVDSVVGIATYEKTLISGQEPIEKAISSGTGFVISEDGYILTNNHVIENGNLIKITTNAGEEHVAELIGKDPGTELAVLKVENLGLEPVPIGSSDEVKTGEMVVAIGNPLGQRLANSVTVGYLSATSRQVLLNGEEMTMLQTDAAINPGNSGGPLINSKGEIIGINTMKSIIAGMDSYGNAISAEGIGFAIPISSAMNIVDTLIRDGSIAKPGIGFTYAHISGEDAQLWQTPRGIVISGIVAGSPADEAGLQPNDIITSIDGVDLTGGAEVPKFDDREIGEGISATIWREGTEYKIEFILADLNVLG